MKEPIPKARNHLYSFGDFRLYVAKRELFRGAEPVALPPKALDTLFVLVSHHGHVVDKDELIATLWPDTFVEEANLGKHIYELRKRLGERPDGGPYIETIARRGYRFSAGVTESWEEEPAEPRLAVAGPSEEAKPAGRRRSRWFAILVLIVAAALWFRFFRPAAKPPEAELKVTPLTSYPGNETSPCLSPDGNQVAFAWKGEQKNHYDIYVKLIDSGQPLQLTDNPTDDIGPAWSPDGSRIAFRRLWRDRAAIYSVSSLGGSERRLADVVGGGGQAWSPDGKSLAFVDGGIFLLSVETGQRRRLVADSEEFRFPYGPAFSPDGQTLAFVGQKGANVADIYVVPVSGGRPKRLTFDNRGISGLTWTPDGPRIVFSSTVSGVPSLWRIPASGGTPERLVWAGDNSQFPSVSARGRRLVYAHQTFDANIYRSEVPPSTGRREPATKLIASTREDANPYYSPDGKRIVFTSNRSGSWELWVCDSNGSNPGQLTSFRGPMAVPWGGWSPDEKSILFDSDLRGNWDVFVIDAEGGPPQPLTTHPGDDARGSWSPDGRWVYFSSNRTGSDQVWKVPAEGGDAVQVTKQGGWTPMLSPDGKFVYYSKSRNRRRSGGIWRIPAGGGEEVAILPEYSRSWLGNWVPVDDGIYFADWEESEPPLALFLGPTKGWIKFLHFGTGRVTEVTPVGTPWEASALAISPDRRWFLYAQVDSLGQDLMLVENFR